MFSMCDIPVLLDFEYNLELRILTKMSKMDGAWHCMECDFVSVKKYNMKTHVEAKHLDFTEIPCRVCGTVCANRRCLRHHMNSHHKSFN